jgi:hypothetical protein
VCAKKLKITVDRRYFFLPACSSCRNFLKKHVGSFFFLVTVYMCITDERAGENNNEKQIEGAIVEKLRHSTS